MGVSLERVQNKFACIIGELCSEPLVLSQFAVWVDLRIAEYKTNGTISLDCSGTSPNPAWMKGVKNPPQRARSTSIDTGQGNSHRRGSYPPNPTSSPISNQCYDRLQPSEAGRYEQKSMSELSVSSRISPDTMVLKQEPDANQSTCALRRKRHSDNSNVMHSDYFSPTKSRRLNEDSSFSKPTQESPSNQSLMSIINTENDSVTLESIDESFPGETDIERLEPELDLTSANDSFNTQNPSTSSGSNTNQPAWPNQFNQSAPRTSSHPGHQLSSVGSIPISSSDETMIFIQPHTSPLDAGMSPIARHSTDDARSVEGRLVTVQKERLINCKAQSPTTLKLISSTVGAVERWLRYHPFYETRHIERIPPEKLDEYLECFFREGRKPNGQDYCPQYLKVVRSCLQRFLKDNLYPVSIVKSKQFLRSQLAFTNRIKMAGEKVKQDTPDDQGI